MNRYFFTWPTRASNEDDRNLAHPKKAVENTAERVLASVGVKQGAGEGNTNARCIYTYTYSYFKWDGKRLVQKRKRK